MAEEESDESIVQEAHKRFLRCEKREATARRRWLEDYQFANGDSENNYQWPDRLYEARLSEERPALTINKTRQHNLQIINDARQNKSGIKYRPVGDGANVKSAEVLEGLARHIQDLSNASTARGQAITFQVEAGLGFTRIVTDYEAENTFDQEIYIRPIDDPLSCYLDPDCTQLDGSDARFGFIFADRPRDQVEQEYPQLKGRTAVSNAVDGEDAGFLRDDYIREAEYYRIKEEEDELIGSSDGTTILLSVLGKGLLAKWEAETAAKGEELRRRPVTRRRLEWFKVVGDVIVDRKEPPGRSIPIIPWIGEETVIEGELDRKGHTRALKDAQRMLNYNRSASVEFGALQSKTPYLADTRAIEGYETYWETANRVNHAVLPYNAVTDDGQAIPPPTRQEPPQSAPVFIEGAQAAERDMMIASGQYEAELGAPGNERSGRAINERQRQGDRATYHFIDNQAMAIRREGQIILELIPEVYDTPRTKRILGEEGDEAQVRIDPDAEAAHQTGQDGDTFNPRIGRYAVVSDVGPDYATQRQEAFDAIIQVITQAPQLLGRIGDLLFRVADFPLADKIAERLKPELPPEAQAAIAELQKQLQQQNKLLGEAMQALTEERLKVKAKDQDAVIRAFEADTHRIAALKDALPIDPEALRALVREEIRQAMQDNLGPAVLSAQPDLTRLGMGGQLPGAAGAMPVETPDLGQQAAMPGGVMGGAPHAQPVLQQ